MGSYGVIKEALLVKKNGPSDEYSVVQKLVPSTVNGFAAKADATGGFETDGNKVAGWSICRGGAFGFSDANGNAFIEVVVNVPGYGLKTFEGLTNIQDVNGIGKCVMCAPKQNKPNAPYTHLCLVVESPGSVFAGN